MEPGSSLVLRGTLEDFEGKRFRIKYHPVAGGGFIGTGRDYLVEEKQPDGTWRKLKFVQKISFQVDVDGIARVEILVVDGILNEEA